MTPSAGSRFSRFSSLGTAIVLALLAIGYVPTRRLSGELGVASMFMGCGIALASSLAAGLLLVMVPAETPEARMKRSFLAMVARLGVATALAAAAVLSGGFSTQPLLLWTVIGYVAELPLEVRFAIYG